MLGVSQECGGLQALWPFSLRLPFPSCSPTAASTKHILDDISTMFDALADQLDAMLD